MTTQQILQGVHDWTNGKIVYDISVAHPDGQGNPTPYADLTAALGNGGANIPEPLRKGGMSIKFVRSSDNKYIQARCMAQTFSTIEDDWYCDEESTNSIIKAESEYLPLSLSSGVYQSGIIPVKENDYIKFSLFWDNALAYVFKFSENADMSDAEFVRNGRVNKMTNGVFSVPKNGYIQTRSLSSGAPETPYVRIVTKKNGIFDISEYNASGTPLVLATYASLNLALAAIPNFKRKGGMTVRYINSSNNKYAQCRYMGTETTGSPNPFLDIANWQGIDDESTAGSYNLITSGAVDKVINGEYIQDNITSDFISGIDEDGTETESYASIPITKLPDRAVKIEAHLYANDNYEDLYLANITLYDKYCRLIRRVFVSAYRRWADVSVILSNYPTAVYYSIRTYNGNYENATASLYKLGEDSIRNDIENDNIKIEGKDEDIDVTSLFEYHKDVDGSTNSGFSSIVKRAIPDNIITIGAKLYSYLTWEGAETAYIVLYNSENRAILYKTVTAHLTWEVISVDLADYPTAKYYSVRTYSENYTKAKCVLLKHTKGIEDNISDLQAELTEQDTRITDLENDVNGHEYIEDITSEFEYHKAYDGSANNEFSSITLRKIPAGTTKISAKLYANIIFGSSYPAYISIRDEERTFLAEKTVQHLRQWEDVSIDLTNYPGAYYFCIMTYSENYQDAKAYLTKYEKGIKEELQELQDIVTNDHPALATEITLNLESGKMITAEGGVTNGTNKFTTQWIHGAGIYKVAKTDITMATRYFPFDICFSPDGQEGTKVVAMKECYHRYIAVPENLPYFRITYYTTSANVCKLYKMKDFADNIINVKEFGAKGDGITDDTYAVQDAIDYVTYGIGGTVFFPAGKYIFNTIQEFDNRKAHLIVPAFSHVGFSPLVFEYDSSKIYYEKSRVSKDGNRYYCLENEVTGAWDPTKWRKFKNDSQKNRINIEGIGKSTVYGNFIASYDSSYPNLNTSALVSTADSDINNGLDSPVSVIACGFGTADSFNNNYSVTINIKGLVISTDNRHGYSRLCGIDMSHSPHTTIEDVTVISEKNIQEIFDGDTGYLQESGHISIGVMMPKLFCDPTTFANGVTVAAAFTIGFAVGDCQQLNNCWVGNSMYGYVFCASGHPANGLYNYCFNSNVAVSVVSQVLYDLLHDTYADWESDTAYSVGDYRFHNYKLYKCKTAHTSGESFDATKWDSCNLLSDYVQGNCWLVMNLLSCELAIGIQPVAFNMQYVCKDQGNCIHGKITYLNADNPAVGIPILGSENITFEDLGN